MYICSAVWVGGTRVRQAAHDAVSGEFSVPSDSRKS